MAGRGETYPTLFPAHALRPCCRCLLAAGLRLRPCCEPMGGASRNPCAHTSSQTNKSRTRNPMN
eukprot:scaffold32044_cov30-Tisochrysis_lutea.AAC.4